MLHLGIPLIISGLAYWGLTALGRLFLRSYAGFGELGIYAVAASFAGVAIIVQNVFSAIWAPLVYKWSATGVDTTKVDQIIEMVVYVIVAMFALAGLASMLVTYILPPEYERVRYLLVACMAYPLFYTLSETTVVGIGLQRKSIYAMTASIGGLLTAIGANYLLVPQYGADGAAIATAISFWVFLVLRTELAILAWRPLPRLKIYGWTLACLTGAVAFVALGSQYTVFFFTQWLILLSVVSVLGVGFFFRHFKPSANNDATQNQP
jgi:O-antigen/teichoic acid export membrane protein